MLLLNLISLFRLKKDLGLMLWVEKSKIHQFTFLALFLVVWLIGEFFLYLLFLMGV